MIHNIRNENKYTPDEKKYILALSRIDGVGPRRFLSLIKKFKTAENVFRASREQISKIIGVKAADLINSRLILNEIDQFINFLNKNEIGYYTIFDKEYPSLLKEIYDPPIVIYRTGDYRIQDFEKSISVVGTRSDTDYGVEAARKIIGELVEAGFTIISGMAFGIDSLAQKYAIDSGGRTVAVLAADAHISSPRANHYLYKRIRKNGCVISEYLLQKEMSAGLFPSRNRIISGLSWGTLVIEAPEKSGALITARSALEQGRDVFAVPGNIFSLKSRGANNLIKNGEAKLVQSARDILEEYGIVFKGKSVKKDIIHTKEEKNIIEFLQKSPAYIDEISLALKEDVSKVSQVITMMEIRHEVAKRSDGRFMLVL